MAKKEKAKAEKKSSVGGSYSLSSPELVKTLDTVKKIVGNIENVDLSFRNGQVYVSAETVKGALSLRSDNTVVEGNGKFSFQTAFTIFKNAIAGRGVITLSEKGGNILIKANRYEAEVHSMPSTIKFRDAGEVDIPTDAIVAISENAGQYLTVMNNIENSNLDILMRWEKGVVEATQIDNFHGIIVRGKIEDKKAKGTLTLPYGMFFTLASLGGKIGFDSGAITVMADRGRASLAQLDTENSPISLNSAITLSERKESGSILVDGTELANLINNAVSVTEFDKTLTATISDTRKSNRKVMSIAAAGRFGKVKGEIEIGDYKGKLPTNLLVNPAMLSDVQCVMDGPLEIAFIDNVIRLTPKKESEWEVVAFTLLLSDK